MQSALVSGGAEAEQLVARALDVNPRSVVARATQAKMLIGRRDYLHAEDVLERALLEAPMTEERRASLCALLIRTYQLQNKYSAIVQLAEQHSTQNNSSTGNGNSNEDDDDDYEDDNYHSFFALVSILYNLAQLKLKEVHSRAKLLVPMVQQEPESNAVLSRYVAFADAMDTLFSRSPQLEHLVRCNSAPYGPLFTQNEDILSSVCYPHDNGIKNPAAKPVYHPLVRAMVMLLCIGTPEFLNFRDIDDAIQLVVLSNAHLVTVLANAHVSFWLVQDVIANRKDATIFKPDFLSATRVLVADAKLSSDSLLTELKKLLRHQ